MSPNESRKSLRDYDNQKQLRAGESQENIVHLSGDASADNRSDISSEDEDNAVDLYRMLGTPFQHPMHDASADEHFALELKPGADDDLEKAPGRKIPPSAHVRPKDQ